MMARGARLDKDIGITHFAVSMSPTLLNTLEMLPTLPTLYRLSQIDEQTSRSFGFF
jgi:hypothetical protein